MKGRGGVDLRYLRRNEIVALARRIGVADTADLDRFLIAWFWHRPSSADKDQIGAVIEIARRMGKPDLTEIEAEEVIAGSQKGRPIFNPDKLGRYLRLSDATRTRIGIHTIGAYDLSKRQRTLRRKQKARERQERLRRRRGALPHSQSLSRTKPWEVEGISRPTWYRRQQPRGTVRQIRNAGRDKFVRSNLSNLTDEFVSPERKKRAVASTPERTVMRVKERTVDESEREDRERRCALGTCDVAKIDGTKRRSEERRARQNPTELVLDMVAKLSPEVRGQETVPHSGADIFAGLMTGGNSSMRLHRSRKPYRHRSARRCRSAADNHWRASDGGHWQS
jgi:hypothetical protein